MVYEVTCRFNANTVVFKVLLSGPRAVLISDLLGNKAVILSPAL